MLLGSDVQVPKQSNGWDCGVYMLKYGEHTLHSLEVIKTIQEEDLPKTRPLERLIQMNEFSGKEIQQQREIFKDLVDTLADKYRKGMSGEDVEESALMVVGEAGEETATDK